MKYHMNKVITFIPMKREIKTISSNNIKSFCEKHLVKKEDISDIMTTKDINKNKISE